MGESAVEKRVLNMQGRFLFSSQEEPWNIQLKSFWFKLVFHILEKTPQHPHTFLKNEMVSFLKDFQQGRETRSYVEMLSLFPLKNRN